MFQKKTVFVLGAGASMAYGFPSGPALRHEVCTKVLRAGDERHNVLLQMRYDFQEVEECRRAIARSWASSIDMFIASRPDYAGITKAAIALTIAGYENDEKLFFADPGDDWFRYLWRFLHNPGQHSLPNSRVSFVTFNYDRTLEHSLANAIRYARGIEAVKQEMLPTIVHVYGSLGPYPFDSGVPDARPFATPSTAENVTRSREFINVPSDKSQNATWPAEAQSLLREAEQVIFLGFGYDQDNLRMLRLLHGDCCLAPGCTVRGTARNLTEQERIAVLALFGRNAIAADKLLLLDERGLNCLMFLRESHREFH